ncbi:acyclic terpene utilization AtuA family protein [Dactylosporangium sp. NPDC051485]|uniref:acyclic terpene utilization AtuA family protein n=1 Tax=Dactylosporangium sp. NPDC051485 TaxID=3154846 RepID=UPI00344998B0
MSVLRIGNASGFYGDRATAWREMLDGGELDVLTGDYLAELTMLILGRDRLKDPQTGYAKTFLRQLESVLGTALERRVSLVTNAGGLNPAGLAEAIRRLAARLGLDAAVAHVEGDDVTARAAEFGLRQALTANAYLGAFGIAECLTAGADVVVTGRVTDASLVVGPGIARFGWTRADLDALAGATVAGHVLECGAQATGGNFAFFTELADGGRRPGFPIAELHADGSAVITKHPGTGGAVTVETVTAQLLYEIAAPAYPGPDVVADFASIRLTPDGPDRVRIDGVRGGPPPDTLKVGVNALGGFHNAMTFVLCGLDIEAKAALVRAQLEDALGPDGLEFALARTDHPDAAEEAAASALLTVHVRDGDAKRAGRTFSQAAVELALASYPGLALTAPPGDATPFGIFTSHAVPQGSVPHVAVLPDGTRRPVDAPRPQKTATSPNNRDAPISGFSGQTVRAPLGRLFGARSGDKGGDANIGVWARDERAYAWLRAELTTERLKQLLPEAAPLDVARYELPNIRAVNFVIHAILGAGVAASTRFDPQGKALGEWLRSRVVDLPEELLA